jgi:hypothetical protein|tara:strand:+ start:2258 stop:2611 length:354 start_codon:yes stop_codon:yes gene_type:complete
MISGIYNMTIEQGSTFNLVLVWKNDANNPINLTGYSAKLQLRASTGASVILLELSSEDSDQIQVYPTQGTVNLTIGHAQTALLPPSIAVYDLELKSAEGVVTKLIKGRCRIEGEVTR